jgi:hypothetical protein
MRAYQATSRKTSAIVESSVFSLKGLMSTVASTRLRKNSIDGQGRIFHTYSTFGRGGEQFLGFTCISISSRTAGRKTARHIRCLIGLGCTTYMAKAGKGMSTEPSSFPTVSADVTDGRFVLEGRTQRHLSTL